MKDWFRERFHGLYWRQMAVTVGMVFLTLVLLGVSFFSLSYSYARGQKTDELMVRAMAVSKLSVRYLETGRYLSMEELQKDEQFRQLAATAAVISEMDILVCDMDGHVLLSTDAAMEGPVRHHSVIGDGQGLRRRHLGRAEPSGPDLCQQAVCGRRVRGEPNHRGGPGGGVHRLRLGFR